LVNTEVKFLSPQNERLFLIIGVSSFAGYLAFSYYSLTAPVNIWLQTILTLTLLLGTLSHYLFILIKITKIQSTLTIKVAVFVGVLLLGHISAWLYTLLLSRKLSPGIEGMYSSVKKKHRPITDRIIQLKIFRSITTKFKATNSRISATQDNE